MFPYSRMFTNLKPNSTQRQNKNERVKTSRRRLKDQLPPRSILCHSEMPSVMNLAAPDENSPGYPEPQQFTPLRPSKP